MNDTWQTAAASLMGRQHRLLGKNRQDAHCQAITDTSVALAVTDGCGSASHSEVGAYLGARLAVEAMIALTASGVAPHAADFAPRVADAVLRALSPLVRNDVEDAFLFTLCGACCTSAGATVFAFGDGVLALGSEVFRLQEVAPEYLGYALLSGHTPEPTLVRSSVEPCTQLVIGSDGCVDVDVVTLARDRRMFEHPDRLRRALSLTKPDDDATLVIACR